MAEKKKILYIVEAMGGGVFTYIVDLANELVNSYDMYIAYMKKICVVSNVIAVSVENFLNLAITPVTTTLYNYFCRVNDEEEHRKVFNYVAVFATIIPAAAFPVKFILEVFLTKYIDSSAIVFLLFSAQIFYTVIRSICGWNIVVGNHMVLYFQDRF